MTLNERGKRLADFMAATADALQIELTKTPAGARILDCGVNARGGLQAGMAMARVCLAGLAEVSLVPGDVAGIGCPQVQVTSDAPIAACMASQYAGWQISVVDYFAMGSGPMRAAYGNEEIYDAIPGREQAPVAIGTVETSQLPNDSVVKYIAESTKVAADQVTLLAARASSMAGNLQVVARSLETALHKLHELKFDLKEIVSGYGVAPLPPVAADELTAIGRTNDAILYGGRVVLWLQSDDAKIAEIGPKIPSCSSADYGTPFAAIFERYNRDFYKIDQMLFSPAEVVMCNLKSGKSQVFGQVEPEVLKQSFLG